MSFSRLVVTLAFMTVVTATAAQETIDVDD
jgi:hypothetical protein